MTSSTNLMISPFETVFIAIYTTLALILGLSGNLLVYVATYKYSSFDVDSITILFIR